MPTQWPPHRDLDDVLRERVRAAEFAYLESRADLERAVCDSQVGTDESIRQIAHDNHDRCFQEYMRLLRVFKNLVLDGVPPDEEWRLTA